MKALTLEELEDLELEEKRINLSIKHNICPKCGNKLIKKDETKNIKYKGLFKTKTFIYTNTLLICEKDETHYKHKLYDDIDYEQ